MGPQISDTFILKVTSIRAGGAGASLRRWEEGLEGTHLHSWPAVKIFSAKNGTSEGIGGASNTEQQH